MLVYWNKNDDAVQMSKADQEVWTHVLDCPSRYAVSNLGRVARIFTKKPFFLRGTPVGKGYLSVGLYPEAGGRSDTRLIHRVVVQAFIGDPPSPNHTDVCHKDGDHTNNRLYNLRWGTRSENMLDVLHHRTVGAAPPPTVQTEGRKWYRGYTEDAYLLQVGLAFFSERKLGIVDLAKLWNTTEDVAANIVRGKRQLPPGVEANIPPAKKRRSKEVQQHIESLLLAGLTCTEVNEKLGETLTAQEAYYYRSRAKARSARP